MEPDFVRNLVDAGDLDPGAGAVCGKLLSIGPGFQPLPQRRIDSTGLYFTPELRHFDRGSQHLDLAAFERTEYVFGASAAAALYRRSMIETFRLMAASTGLFHISGRCDLAWSAIAGWRCIYLRRGVACAHGSSGQPAIDYADIQHAFREEPLLMHIKNATPGLYRRYWLPMTLRDLVVVAAASWPNRGRYRRSGIWQSARPLPGGGGARL
jgi:hypothetical protein